LRFAALFAGLFLALGASADAQDKPGDFDFYVLTLSWSPSYCAAEGTREGDVQCTSKRPYAFVVHGLWPQYENGFPEFCNRRAPRVPQRLIDNMLDLMPSPRLVIHQWRKHGTCSGEDARGYFETVREARAAVTIPPEFVSVDSWRMVSPGQVESAFREANAGLPRDAIAVTCDGRHLREVRICMTRGFSYRPCPEIDRRACRAGRVAMPPSR
jgi:ribonuclease T2